MKEVLINVSLPKDTVDLMMELISVLKKALEEKVEELRKEYAQANEDPNRIEVIRDWSSLDGESWDD